MKKQKITPGTSTLGFHQGGVLRAVSDKYRTLHQATLEVVQNAIDANPSHVWINVNFRNRSIIVRDDGEGVSRDRLERALALICSSQKTKGKLGRFGMGLMAPLTKCREFKFTSCPQPSVTDYITWTFSGDLVKHETLPPIPLEHRHDLHFTRNRSHKANQVPWRSTLEITDFTEDNFLSKITIDSLSRDILDNFGGPMRANKTVIYLTMTTAEGSKSSQEISAKEFQGEKLPEAEYTAEHCGTTTFNLYLSPSVSGRRKGIVLFGERDDVFRLNAAKVFRSYQSQGILPKDMVEALTSGVFAGEIVSGIHLHESRKSFVTDDAFVDFCTTLEAWYKEVGEPYMEEVRTQQAEQRYQELGLRSMNVLEALIAANLEQSLPIREALSRFQIGRVGPGHVPIGTSTTTMQRVGVQDVTSLAAGVGEKPPRADKGKERDPKTEPAEDQSPFSVAGPRGQRRIKVKSGSLGLQFQYDEMPNSNRVCELDPTEGVIRFNIRHPFWAECEANDHTLMRFQEYVALQTLIHYGLDDSMKLEAELAFDAMLPPYVFILVHGDEFARRKPGRKSATPAAKSSIRKSA